MDVQAAGQVGCSCAAACTAPAAAVLPRARGGRAGGALLCGLERGRARNRARVSGRARQSCFAGGAPPACRSAHYSPSAVAHGTPLPARNSLSPALQRGAGVLGSKVEDAAAVPLPRWLQHARILPPEPGAAGRAAHLPLPPRLPGECQWGRHSAGGSSAAAAPADAPPGALPAHACTISRPWFQPMRLPQGHNCAQEENRCYLQCSGARAAAGAVLLATAGRCVPLQGQRSCAVAPSR